MSDIPEAIGAAGEGALFARAVEPLTGETGTPLAKGHFTELACLNCGTQIVGAYCHACGQQAHLHRTIGAFLHDLLHGALHFDGKTWRTLPLLAFRPGQLTRRYIAGERARFVSPMALFLFSIFLMFAVFQITGIGSPAEIQASTDIRAQAAKEREALEARLAKAGPNSSERKEIEEDLEGLAKADDFILEAEMGLDGAVRSGDSRAEAVDKGSGIAWIDNAVGKWRKNPDLMFYKLKANFYKFSWLLIPLSVPFVWLLFALRRTYFLYDHAVFVTYSLSFVSLLFIVLAVATMLGVPEGIVTLAVLILPAMHMYKQLRHAYALSRLSTLWRLAALMVFIAVILTIFLQFLVLLGMTG